MNINLLSDEKLAKEIKVVLVNEKYIYGEFTPEMAVVKFLRQCVKDSQKELVEVLREILITPIRVEDIEKLDKTHEVGFFVTEKVIKKAKQALASVKEKDSHVV